jgi:glycosyltransferase involved in cell wall biosynthesis
MRDGNSISGGRRHRGRQLCTNPGVPTVSVITAVFNARDCIANCIQSVLAQDYQSIEYIVVDAASNDGTIEVIRRYDDSIDIWISEPDNGIFDAWNKGLELATGEWVAFLGADDVYLPSAIRDYMSLALEHAEAEFLCSRAQLVHSSGYAPVFGGPWKWPTFARAMTTIHVGTMHRRSLFERYGNFDASYRIAGDYEFLLRARNQLQTAFMDTKTVLMRAGGASDSTAGLYEARRAKISAGVRSRVLATLDLIILVARFHVRSLVLHLYALRR